MKLLDSNAIVSGKGPEQSSWLRPKEPSAVNGSGRSTPALSIGILTPDIPIRGSDGTLGAPVGQMNDAYHESVSPESLAAQVR